VEDPDGIHRNFVIFDRNVSVDRDSTVFVNTDYRSLQLNDVVEISGFFDSAGTLVATRVAGRGVLDSGTVVEVRGTVSAFNGIDTFSIGALDILFTGTTVFEDLPGTVANGQYVEVNGVLQGATSILASRIEREGSSVSDHSGDISIEGLVTTFTDIGNFSLDGLPVDASVAIFSPATLAASLTNNLRIEVEGTITAGRILASRVERRSGEVKLAGRVTASDAVAGIFHLEIVAGQPPIPVTVDVQTQLEDELLAVQSFTLLDFSIGDPVLAQGYLGNAGEVVASEVKRRILDEYTLAGPASAASGDATSGSVTILGVTMATDSGTQFEDSNDQPFPNGGDDFYSQVVPGDLVELQDSMPVDGSADEVELKH
jgi:hypothetical protein